MSDLSNINYLFYVRKFSIVTGDYELYVYGSKTDDVYHTIGEMYSRSMTSIKRIDYVQLNDENRDFKLSFWDQEGYQVRLWKDIY